MGHKKTAKVCDIATDILRDVEIHMKTSSEKERVDTCLSKYIIIVTR